MTKLTHLVYSAIQVTSATNMTLAFRQGSSAAMTSFVTKCHAAGIQALVNFYDATTGRLGSIVGNSTRLATLMTNLVNFIATYNLDGIEIDWEEDPRPTDYQTIMNTFITALRAALPDKLIILVGYTDWEVFMINTATEALIDYWDLDTYYWWWYYPQDPIQYKKDFITSYINHGYTASKLLVGIPVTRWILITADWPLTLMWSIHSIPPTAKIKPMSPPLSVISAAVPTRAYCTGKGQPYHKQQRLWPYNIISAASISNRLIMTRLIYGHY